MKKLCVFLCAVLFVLLPLVACAEETNQIVYKGGTVFFDKNGAAASGPLGSTGAVVEMSKTIEPYVVDGKRIENDFVITLDVKTTEAVESISSDTPDAALMLTFDVSNSMNYCAHCGKSEGDDRHDTYYNATPTVHYYCPGQTTTVYTRATHNITTNKCTNCSRYEGEHTRVVSNYQGAKCAFESRLTLAKRAARDFVSQFLNDTGVTGDDKRKIAIVTFGSIASRRLDWMDVTSTSISEVFSSINGIQTKHQGTSYDDNDDGGTNIEAALRLSRNVIMDGRNAAGKIQNYDYIYTVLFSDGYPTYYNSNGYVAYNSENNNAKTYISGTSANGGNNSGSTTNEDDFKDVDRYGTDIRGVTPQSKLFSITFGKTIKESKQNTAESQLTSADFTSVFNEKPPFGSWTSSSNQVTVTKDTTVGGWLGMFSNAAYDGEASGLFDVFSTVSEQIRIATSAWKVTDNMGPHIHLNQTLIPVYPVNHNGNSETAAVNNTVSYTDAGLVWDVLLSNPTYTRTGSGKTIVGYTYKYHVTLDNLKKAYADLSDPDTEANQSATLLYSVQDSDGLWKEPITAAFVRPEVKGLEGTFEFVKYVKDESTGKYTTLSGVSFRLFADGNPLTPNAEEWISPVVTSDENGKVVFSGIPSGHKYWVEEYIHPDNEHLDKNYINPGDSPVNVAWGEASFDLSDSSSQYYRYCEEHKQYEIINHAANEKLARLTIRKDYATGTAIRPGVTVVLRGAPYSEQSAVYDLSDEIEKMTAEAVAAFSSQLTLPTDKGTMSIDQDNLLPGVYYIEENAAELESDHPGYSLEISHNGNPALGAAATSQKGKVRIVIPRDKDTYNEYSFAFINKFTRKTGTLSVSKSFWEHTLEAIEDGNIESNKIPLAENLYKDLSATFHVYPVGSEDPLPGVEIEVNADGEWKKDNISLPIGSYRLVEIDDHHHGVEGYRHAHTLYTPATFTVTEGENTHVAVENHYEQLYGRIRVIKLVHGTANIQSFVNAQQSITVEIRSESGALMDTLTLRHNQNNILSGWNASSKLLPLGTYTVTETAGAELTGKTHSVRLEGEVDKDGKVVIDDHLDVLEVEIHNTYADNAVSLTASKTFEGVADASALLRTSIYLDLYRQKENSSDFETSPTVQFVLSAANAVTTADGKIVWQAQNTNVPRGTYLVREQTPRPVPGYKLTGVTISGSQVSTDANGSTLLTITGESGATALTLSAVNTYEQALGSLVITKEIDGDHNASDFLAGGIYSAIDFTFVVTDPAGNKIGEITLPKDGDANPWSHTIANLPMNVPYTVTETPDSLSDDAQHSGHSTLLEVTVNGEVSADRSATLVLSDDAPGAAIGFTFKNTYRHNKGQLKVTKLFGEDSDLKAADFSAGGQFEGKVFTVTGDHTDADVADLAFLLKEGSWSDTQWVHNGTIQIAETADAQIENYTLTTTYTGLDQNGKVTVQNEQLSEVAVVNTYKQHKGRLQVRKVFGPDSVLTAADFPEGINIRVLDSEDKQVDMIYLNAANDWINQSADLPVGTYTLEEVDTQREGYTLHVDYDGLVDHKCAVTNGQNAYVTITNTYIDNPATVSFTKTFSGLYDDPAQRPKSIDFVLTSKSNPDAKYRVTLSADADPAKDWKADLSLPMGVYTVSEEVTAPDGYRIISSFTGEGLSADNKITLEPGETYAIACDNFLEKMLEVFLPLRKNVVQGGQLPPSKDSVFSFSLESSIPAASSVIMDVVPAVPAQVVSYNAVTGELLVRMDASGAFSGHVLFSGFGEDLAKATLTIRENPHPFASTADAQLAGWTYDPAVYAFSMEGGANQVKAALLKDGKPANEAAFANVYTVNLPAGGLPETGDNSRLMLWLALLALCAAAFAVKRTRA